MSINYKKLLFKSNNKDMHRNQFTSSYKRNGLNIFSFSFFLWHLLTWRWSHHLSNNFLSFRLWTFSSFLFRVLESVNFKMLWLFWKNRAWNHRKIINLLNWTFVHHTMHFMILLCLLFKIEVKMIFYWLILVGKSGYRDFRFI